MSMPAIDLVVLAPMASLPLNWLAVPVPSD
jgi:hypothetical protein